MSFGQAQLLGGDRIVPGRGDESAKVESRSAQTVAPEPTGGAPTRNTGLENNKNLNADGGEYYPQATKELKRRMESSDSQDPTGRGNRKGEGAHAESAHLMVTPEKGPASDGTSPSGLRGELDKSEKGQGGRRDVGNRADMKASSSDSMASPDAKQSRSVEAVASADTANRISLESASGKRDERTSALEASGIFRKEIVDLDKESKPVVQVGDHKTQQDSLTQTVFEGRPPNEPYTRKGPFEIGDTIPVKANLTGVPEYIRLDVLKSHIESVTGVEIKRNSLYEIKGSVVGAYDFDIYRTVGKYVYLIPSLEQRDKVRPGRVYDVKIESVREVPLTESQREILGGPQKRGAWRSTMYKLNHAADAASGADANGRMSGNEGESKAVTREPELPSVLKDIGASFDLEARQHNWGNNRHYFRIRNSLFEEKTGMNVEEMRDYVIRGHIQGVGDIQKTLHRCATGQDIPIYVPAKLQDKVEVGKKYTITIDSIEKLPPRRGFWEGRQDSNKINWDWKEVASWVDTEGWIGSKVGHGRYAAFVCQKERGMLDGLGEFLAAQGLEPKLRFNKNDGVYQVGVSGAEQAALVVKNIEPYIRTVNKQEQIERFKDALAEPRKSLKSCIRIARKTLGIIEEEA